VKVRCGTCENTRARSYGAGCLLWLEVEGAGDLVDTISLAIFGIVPEPHFLNPLKVIHL